METKLCLVLFWLSLYQVVCVQEEFDPDLSEETWRYRQRKSSEHVSACHSVRPTTRDLIRRLYAILPYFDKEHSNTAFLHKYRATIYGMSEAEDMLDREVAFYTAFITPLVFLQQHRDMWCLLERFHRAIRLFQISHPTQKRSALKLLQNLRAVNQKISTYIANLPGPVQVTRAATQIIEMDEDDIQDKKDIRYLKELIKNLG